MRGGVHDIVLVASLSFVLGAGCAGSDIGSGCPEMTGDFDRPPASDDSLINTTSVVEVVEQNVRFPCDSLVCVATAGDEPYCSQRCRNEAGCPNGFECRQVQTIGPFAEDQFCAFRRCQKDDDCGDTEQFVCQVVPGLHPTEEVKLCRFKNE